MPDSSRTRLGSTAFSPSTSSPPTREAIEAFTVAATAWRPDLVRFVARILRGDVDRASDLVQDAMLAAWRHLGGLRDPHLLRAWLYRTSYRNAISSIRRRGPRGRPIVALDAGAQDAVPARSTQDAARVRIADDWTDAEELLPRMRAFLPTLPPSYEQAIRLHYLDALGLRDVATVLGVPIPTLKMRLHRGRALLRRRLVAEETRRRFDASPAGRGMPAGRRTPAGRRRPPPPPLAVRPTGSASGSRSASREAPGRPAAEQAS